MKWVCPKLMPGGDVLAHLRSRVELAVRIGTGDASTAGSVVRIAPPGAAAGAGVKALRRSHGFFFALDLAPGDYEVRVVTGDGVAVSGDCTIPAERKPKEPRYTMSDLSAQAAAARGTRRKHDKIKQET